MSFLPLLLVFIATTFGLLSAILLKFTSTLTTESMLLIVFLFCLVLLCNFGRMIVWGFIYKRYSISYAYPLSSIFFPLILAVSYFFYGEEMTFFKIAGVMLIVAGIIVITRAEGSPNEKD